MPEPFRVAFVSALAIDPLRRPRIFARVLPHLAIATSPPTTTRPAGPDSSDAIDILVPYTSSVG